MTDNTTLDAAIEAALNAIGALKHDTWTPNEGDYIYARALIAELLEGMEPPLLGDKPHPALTIGYNAALTEIRRRSGIEGDEV